MLRLSARYADAWNTAWFGAPDERLRERLEHLDAALAAEGRDPATLERTVGIEVRDPEHVGMADDGEDRSFRGSVDELAEAIDAYEALGIGHLIVVLQPMTEASLERLTLALSRRR
jgi:alkanesulfonate monooxygenase SsuD/methylene tetrahydromethanopterin reductase-like flavin-dependent oxidoreductase (luciferase family)